ncbi:hypothetical protein B0J11DRAFT_611656 [Dendryphion nanum]|uniref:Peptidase C1A papain C-terminal domain-containing protein n=1 Tax=Dendryphion nanum TaxID=256645 RepID=A0A9P9IUC7_9PLEO|nr:hypothetical protein B0J11DRAFT_611656 [Dendryphion nanum]
MIFHTSRSLAALLYLGGAVTFATPTPLLELRDVQTPNNLTNTTLYATGSNMTLESQNAVPPASDAEIESILSERIAYRFIEERYNSNTTNNLALTTRQIQARPRNVDWRLRWGNSWLHSIQNQGVCNSCWAFAATALVESMTRIEHGIWAKRSEGDMRDGTLDAVPNNQMDYCGQSGDYVGALNWAKNHGVTDLECWPYHAFNVRTTIGYRPCGERSGRTVTLTSGITNLGTNVENQKAWIDKVGPIIANLDIPAAFQWHKGAGVYSSPAEGQPGSQWVGQHMLLVVGYDDDRGAWLVRNSWGTGWGDNGYAWYWGKAGLRDTNPDPWSSRRQQNGNMIRTGRTGIHRKNFEMAVCRASGHGVHWLRAGGENGDISWKPIANIWTPPPAGQGCQGQPALLSTTNNRNLALLYWSTGNFLVHKRYDQTMQRWTEAVQFGNGRIGGYPSLIQKSGSGLATAVRFNDGSFVHYETTNSASWDWRQQRVIAANGVRMSGPTMIQTNTGHLYTVAVMENSSLQLYWLNNNQSPAGQWQRGENFGFFVGWTPPVMIQTAPSWAGTSEHVIGDFELFVVVGGSVFRYRRDNSDLRAGQVPVDVQDGQAQRWKYIDSFRSPDGRVKNVWSAMQGPFAQHLEVAIELEDGKMQTMFLDWDTNTWKLSMAAGGFSAVLWLSGEAKAQEQYTIGTASKVNVDIAELAAIKEAVDWVKAILADMPIDLEATVYSDCMSALQAIANPAHQSGQALIADIAQTLCEAESRRIRLAWIPAYSGIPGTTPQTGQPNPRRNPEARWWPFRDSRAGFARWVRQSSRKISQPLDQVENGRQQDTPS